MNRGDELPRVLQQVGVAQHLNGQLPLNANFVDDTGKPVTLGTYFNGKTAPAVFSLVYFDCPMLCSEELDGMTSALEMVHLTPGKDFDVVVVSIDPADTPSQGRREEGVLPQAVRPSRDRRRLALPHGPASCDQCSYRRGRLRLCEGSGSGRQAHTVRPCKLH